jgi:hypothetical protein
MKLDFQFTQMMKDEIEKKNNNKKEQKKSRSIRLTHKTCDLSHKTEIT